MKAIDAVLRNPPKQGVMEVYNQLDGVYSINELGEAVRLASERVGLKCAVSHVPNPRVEKAEHHYNPDHSKLRDIGFRPVGSLEEEITDMMETLWPLKGRITAKSSAVAAEVKWR